jgi:hypothetical protein
MNIQELKRQLNIEAEYTDDDIILQQYLNVAESSVLNYLNYYTGSTSGVTGTNMPAPVLQGILLFAAHLYTTRQIISYGQGYKIPYTFEFLLNPYKEYTVN